MAGYVKLFGSILQSTVWEEDPEIRVVWITMLALADRHGEVMASVPGLARTAQVSRAACDRALKRFTSPDRDSRTKADGGRRIEAVDGGWLILNYAKYRDMAGREDAMRKNADRQRRWRERQRVTLSVTDRDANSPPSASASASPPTRDQSQRALPPGVRVGTGPRPRTRTGGIDLVAGTDRKLAEMRDAATRAATPEEIEELRRSRGTGAA